MEPLSVTPLQQTGRWQFNWNDSSLHKYWSFFEIYFIQLQVWKPDSIVRDGVIIFLSFDLIGAL